MFHCIVLIRSELALFANSIFCERIDLIQADVIHQEITFTDRRTISFDLSITERVIRFEHPSLNHCLYNGSLFAKDRKHMLPTPYQPTFVSGMTLIKSCNFIFLSYSRNFCRSASRRKSLLVLFYGCAYLFANLS